MELVKCHYLETFPYQNSFNHENCNIKFSLNLLSDQVHLPSFFWMLWRQSNLFSSKKELYLFELH